MFVFRALLAAGHDAVERAQRKLEGVALQPEGAPVGVLRLVEDGLGGLQRAFGGTPSPEHKSRSEDPERGNADNVGAAGGDDRGTSIELVYSLRGKS